MSPTPEAEAREKIDLLLEKAGWMVQDARAANIHAAQGVAIREFALAPGHGHAVNMPRGFRPHCRHGADRLRQAILKKAFAGQLLSSAYFASPHHDRVLM